ncbi:hypothetical protein KP014_15770 [Paenibacillus sophorae]|uniref:Uncharacterized protein n=1 Tax=Paenibacillus sophorae TaxID=1333845 RepID=A0ABX8H6B3_9BACL|nr:hypothetical protein [Paenibacillus sophorae]QWU13454.1 hypothetical protein KP014_15770 [Paenibacillus sophorae]
MKSIDMIRYAADNLEIPSHSTNCLIVSIALKIPLTSREMCGQSAAQAAIHVLKQSV